MDITVIAVGKTRQPYLVEAVEHYRKKIGRKNRLVIREIPEEGLYGNAGSAEIEKAKEAEGEKIMKALPRGAAVVTLDIEGRMFTDAGMAARFKKLARENNGHLCLVIGGSWGLCGKVKETGDLSVSFSRMTFPHQLCRVVLLEQLDRIF